MKNRKQDNVARLFLRLPEETSHPLLWRLAGTAEPRSGSVAAGESDPQLTSLLTRYPAWVLVPASKIAFHQVTLPHRTRHRRLQVLPFMLEEQMATDIETLHFAILAQSGDRCDVAVVEKDTMRDWLAQCDDLNVQLHRLLPDVLMLPWVAGGWSAVQLDGQWLFRRDQYAGMAVESSWLPALLALSAPPVIETYAIPPVECPEIAWRRQPVSDLLQLAAARGEYEGADLCQGEFTHRRGGAAGLRRWKPVLFALTGLACLICLRAGLAHYQLWQQSEQQRQENVRFYQRLFPGERVVNPRAQMLKHRQSSPAANPAGLSEQIRQLQQLLAEDPAVRLQALAWDSSQQTFKLDLQATSFQALEQFQQHAGENYVLQPGEVQQDPQGVTSRISLGVRHE